MAELDLSQNRVKIYLEIHSNKISNQSWGETRRPLNGFVL